MKMRFMEYFGNGSQSRKPWMVLGLLLLSLVSMEVAIAQKPASVSPSPQSGGSVGLPGSAKPADGAQSVTPASTERLRALTTSMENGNLVVSVTPSAPVEHREYLFDGPTRLVMDLWNVESRVPFQKLDIDSGGVKQVRIGEFLKGERKTTRLVFDLEPGTGKYEVQTNGPVIRVVFPAKQGLSETKAVPQTEAPKPPVPKVASPKPASPKATDPAAPVPNRTASAASSVPAAKVQTAPAVEQTVAPKPAAKPTQSPAKSASLPTSPVVAAPPTVAKQTAAKQAQPPVLPEAKAAKSTAEPTHTSSQNASVPVQQVAAAPPVVVKKAPAKQAQPPVPPEATAAKPPATERPVAPKPTAEPTHASTKNASVPVQQVAAAPPTVVKASAAKQAPPPVLPEAAALTAHDHLTVNEVPRPAQPATSQVTETVAYRPVPIQVSPSEQPHAKIAEPPSGPAVQAQAGQESHFTGTPLTLDLVDIALVDFFRLMAEEGGINIVLDPEIKGTLSMKVVKVPWDQIFEAALRNNGLDKQVEGNLVRIARKATLQDEAKQHEALKKANLLAADLETRIKRLNYAKAANLIPTLTEQKSVRGTVVFDERTNSLILIDLPSSIQKMLELVETLDIAQPQVEIEARIVSATRDFARDIGVQFGFVQGNLERVTVGGPNTFGTIGGTRPAATPTTTYAAGNPRTGRGASEGTSSQSAGTSTGTGSGQQAGNWNVNLAAQKAFGGVGISVGNIFDTFLLDAAITAGENKGLAKLISQPKTVTTNNSPATITQGLRFPVQIIANNTITVQFQNAALTLVATPQITYEGNVILDLSIENNTADFSKAVNGIPSIRTSESKTRVLVTDGGTTVIGGILIDQETTSEDRIPGLASLPMIGYLFKRTSVSHSTQEVLFFITPKIIK